jgi:hypothetical protein
MLEAQKVYKEKLIKFVQVKVDRETKIYDEIMKEEEEYKIETLHEA